MSAFGKLLKQFETGGQRPIRILGASGQLGYGIPTDPLNEGLRRQPDLIGCDMGSIDIGPYYLGSGSMAISREAAKRDLRKVLIAARSIDAPLIVGSAGSAGAAPHLAQTLEIVREIASEEDLRFRLAAITADISRDEIRAAIVDGRIAPMDGMAPLSDHALGNSTHVVAQMGLEMIQKALLEGADVVVAGRACDTGIFAALPILLGFPAGLAIHLAKIVECASLCCVPGGRDAILATLDADGFELESMNPHRAATPASVAAHSLYEQADPYSIYEPCGRVDLRSVIYAAVDNRRARVTGAQFEPSPNQKIKLEGARLVGERAILLCANADPRFINRRELIAQELDQIVQSLVCEDSPRDYQLLFRFYGINGVMPASIINPALPSETGIVVECVAPTAERALSVLRTTKQYLLHFGYEGRLSTAGNLAFPFTPPEIVVGPAYEFSIYHLMEIEDQAEHFKISIEQM